MAADALSQATSLAGVMEEAGPSCSAEVSLSSIMSNLPAPTEHAVAEVLGMIARTSKGIQPNTPPAWNVDIIIDALKAANPAIDWRHVAELLDQPEFDVPDNAALETLMQAWQHATTDPFPIASLTGRPWNNSAGQLAFIRAATASSPEVFPWDHCEGRQQPLENLHAGKPSSGTANGCWLCLSLYSVLATLADSGHSSAVRDIMEVPLKTCPEIMLLGVASVNGGWGPLQSELCDSLAVTYVAPHPNSSLVLNRLWHLNQSVVLRAMVSLYSKDISNISRVMEVCQELRSLTEVLNGTPTPFCLELAALASRREYLNLEKWLGEQFGSRGVGFMQDTVKFLADRDDQLTPGASGGKINISVETQAIYLKALARSTDLLPTDTLQQFKVVYGAAVASNSQLQTLLTDVSSFEAFAPDIEEETTAYLQKVYNGELTVEQFVETLKSFKNSTVGREQEVLACLVYNLFDEYRFYCKYPEKELSITAVLFGQLIHQGLVSSITLGVALRYVLEALRSPPAENLFGFATSAIRQFQDEMSQWIKFCQQALGVPGLQERDAELYAIIEKQLIVAMEKEKERAAKTAAAAAAAASAAKSSISVTGISPISSSSSSSATTVTSAASAMRGIPAAAMAAMTAPLGTKADGSASSNNAGFPTAALPVTPSNPNMLFSTINAETLEHAAQDVSFPVPDDSLIDKVHFVVNNLALANIDAKVRELRDLVHAPYYPWFANYMVVKRAAQEPNFHGVYSALVDKWEDRSFRNSFISTTVHYCRVMLISKLLKSNSSERTLLKNLGAWLGKITLAKNRPVLQKHLDVKATIIKAYEEGKMLAVLSFIRQLLDPAIDSKVFRPPNPWVMAICALLAEIYNLENLKTGLKFEVELLFKSLGMNVVDVEPSSLLVGRTREIADNMDFQAPRPIPGAAAGAGAAGGAAGAAKAPGADAVGPDGKPAAVAATPVIDPNIIANLHTFIVINPQLQIVGERLGLRRILPMAIDRAVVEIISPVVERSVTIACMTAQELVAKDYATEPEPETVRKAAHLAVTGLAQSLALATAKEPLRMAVGNNLRALLTGQLDAAMLEQVVALLVSDNLDLCCQVIEKAAGERAQREIDERLAPAYTARARAKTANQAFVDQSQFKGRFPASLPEALRPRPAALTPQQTRVYEDFAHIPRTAAAAQQQGGGGAAAGGEGGATSPAADGNVSTTAADAAADLRTRFLNWLQRFDAAISKDPQALLSSLPEGHEVRQLALEAATIPTNEATALDVAKTVFARLYQGNPPTRLHVTAYAGALEALRERVIPRLPAEVTAHFVNLTDEGKFRRDACEALVRARILVPADLDIHLAKSLGTPRYQPPADLIVHLLQSCVIPEPGVLSINDLVHSTNALAKLAARFTDGHSALALLEEARRVSLLRSGAIKSGAPGAAGAGGLGATAAATVAAAQEGPKDPPALVETVMKMFDRWARLLEEMPGERQHAAFVQELRGAGFLGGSRDMTERFVRIMIQLAVQHCLRSEVVTAPASAAAAGQPPQQRTAQLSFIAVDAFVRLMVCLVTQHGGGPPLLSKILGILATALQRDAEEKGTNFNGRPYYRMIVGFLTELTPQKPDQEDTANMGYLQCIAGFLYATRALRVPSFAFPWLQILADKRFMPRMLYAPRKTGWPALLQLWLAQLRFLEPFLRNAELNDALRLLYKGTVRTLLVILHDQPEFLCQFSFQFCDVIPPSSIQLRNMILSAFPRSLRLPDPFTPNLKVDTLPGIVDVPPFVPENIAELLPEPVRNDVEAVMLKQAPAPACLQALRPRLTLPSPETVARGTRYNVPLLNALVFYLGVRSVQLNPPSEGMTPQLAGTPAAELMLALLRELDTEGRYLLLNAAANHLRYPNAHTHYFSCMILHCFDHSTGNEIVKEQITRVLLERLVVNRPHPWGLLITFIELIKNPRYTFWQHAFTRVAPEIERLFDNVARSCLRQNTTGEGGGEGGGGGGRPAAAFPSAA
jgi:CCR4-NOT transcription complex subunit 1